MSLSATKTEYCISDFVELKITNVPTTASIEWDLGDGYIFGNSTFLGTTFNDGTLDADVRVTLSSGTECNYTSKNVTTIRPLPIASFIASRSLLCSGTDTITLFDLIDKSARISWVINNKILGNTDEVALNNLPGVGNQNVTLVAEDSFGCTGSKTLKGLIKGYNDINLDFDHSNKDNCYPISTNYSCSYNLYNQIITSVLWSLPGSDKNNNTAVNINGVE